MTQQRSLVGRLARAIVVLAVICIAASVLAVLSQRWINPFYTAFMAEAQLDAWAGDAQIKTIVVQGAGERAFCAGGDIRSLYESGKAGTPYALDFYRDEYILDAAIKHYSKPFIALISGIHDEIIRLFFALGNNNCADYQTDDPVVSFISICFLIPWELGDKQPVIDLHLFNSRNFRVGRMLTLNFYHKL